MRAVVNAASFGSYRRNTISAVLDQFDGDLVFVGGDRPYDKSIKILRAPGDPVVTVRNVYLPKNVLLQWGSVRGLITADVAVMDLNPRELHVWLVLLFRRCMRRRTLLWGHVWPRAGRGSRSDRLRGLMRSLAGHVITYTQTQASELREAAPSVRCYVAPNALYSKSAMKFDSSSKRDKVVYVGRLEPDKNPKVLIDAWNIMHRRGQDDLTLFIVGDGSMRDELEKQSDADSVVFTGWIDDFDRLREIFARSIVSISPGFVGLSAIQSLAFGVPIVYAEGAAHSPEIEALDETNSRSFSAGNAASLAAVLTSVLNDRDVWHLRGSNIASECSGVYSTEAMSAGICRALHST